MGPDVIYTGKIFKVAFSEEFTGRLNAAVEYLTEYYDLLDEDDPRVDKLALLINFLKEALEENGTHL